jgi:hypothetical protein
LSVVGCRLPTGKDNRSGFFQILTIEFLLKTSASIDACPTDIDNFSCH